MENKKHLENNMNVEIYYSLEEPSGIIVLLCFLCVPSCPLHPTVYTDDLPRHIFDEITHFFSVYKQLEEKETAVDTVQGRDAALRIIQEALDNYRSNFIMK